MNAPLTLTERVIQTRLGGKVERCHGIPHQGSYSVAAHSWGVAMLLQALWPDDFERLVLHALAHDVHEAWVGDIPSPVMRYVPGLNAALGTLEDDVNNVLGLPQEGELSLSDLEKIKTCDRLEFYLWSREQVAMGNAYAQEGLQEIERYFEERPLPSPAKEFYDDLRGRSVLGRQAGVVKAMMERLA